jgi:L-idonate 5-dehydrogenase
VLSTGADTSTPTTTAVVAYGPGDLRVEERPLRRPGTDEAVVHVVYGGICGSDLHYWRHGSAGESVLRAPMVLGHEVVGTVSAPAADGSGPPAGTRVAVHPATQRPGDGGRYPADRPNLAPGGTYLGSAAHFPHADGAFARQVVLPSRMLRRLPGNLDWDTAALIEPSSVAWHAVGRAGNLAGRRALVVGAGPIGLLIMAAARHAGAGEVVAVDLHDQPLRLARQMGATGTLHARDADGIADADADVAFESSGTAAGLGSAVCGTTRGGRVVMVGLLPAGDQPVPISLAITRELELCGSFRFADEIDDVIAAMAAGSFDPSPVVTHRFGIDHALEAFATAADPMRSSKVLLDFR